MAEYLGCNYTLRPRGPNKFHWSAFDGTGPGAPEIARGDVDGDSKKAGEAAQKAIKEWVEKREARTK